MNWVKSKSELVAVTTALGQTIAVGALYNSAITLLNSTLLLHDPAAWAEAGLIWGRWCWILRSSHSLGGFSEKRGATCFDIVRKEICGTSDFHPYRRSPFAVSEIAPGLGITSTTLRGNSGSARQEFSRAFENITFIDARHSCPQQVQTGIWRSPFDFRWSPTGCVAFGAASHTRSTVCCRFDATSYYSRKLILVWTPSCWASTPYVIAFVVYHSRAVHRQTYCILDLNRVQRVRTSKDCVRGLYEFLSEPGLPA